MSRDNEWLIDIANAAQDVIVFRGDMDEQAFENDLKSQAAIMHRLMLIGEAVKRLSDEFRAANPQFPWKQIAGLRDQLIHSYDKVQVEIVWQVVCDEIPKLHSFVRSIQPSPDEELDNESPN